MIKLHALGGYGEYGRNMTALEFANEIIILDCGIKLQKNSYTETLKITPDFTNLLIEVNDISELTNLMKK